MRSSAKLVASALAMSALTAPSRAHAAEIQFGTYDVPTTFYIAKSDDRNRVDYGMRLDASCAPVGSDAVFPYWREFEKAPPVRTHDISFFEKVPYGVADQKVLRRNSDGVDYAILLKQLNRIIYITTKKQGDGKCSALVRSNINGVLSQLDYVYAKLAGFASVDYIDVFGKNMTTGAAVSERIKK